MLLAPHLDAGARATRDVLVAHVDPLDPAGAIARLLEMGVEPYQISSALTGVLSQRLLRRRAGDGYKGRVPAAEWVAVDDRLRRLVADRADSSALQQAYAEQDGYESLEASVRALVSAGVTDIHELHRVFG